MGKMSRNKGGRHEREVQDIFESHGFDATRDGWKQVKEDPGDVTLCGHKIECKHREMIGNYLWEWLGDNFALVFRKNRKPNLVLMSIDTFMELMKKGKEC
jgi:hypothetical protein